MSRLRTAALALLMGLLVLAPARGQDAARLADLDAYITRAATDWAEVPGFAVGIVRGDSLVFAKGYGTRTLGEDAPVDAHTRFAVASNTKAFTAAVLGLLVEEGRLGWDDRVADLLPGFQLHDPYVTREITVRDLLTHRSGLPTFGGDHLWIGSTLGRDEVVARLRHLAPSGDFRGDFQYQNLMYLVAGELVPAVTGQSWDAFLRERLLDPLGMTESTTDLGDLSALANVASPHEVVGGRLQPIAYDDVDGVAPAAALVSNVVDLAKWMRLNLHDGAFEGEAVLAPETVREMQRIQFPLPVSSSNETNFGTRFYGYGLGWFVSDYRGRKLVSHSGGLSGMISLQTMLPEEDLGVVVLTNLAPNSLSWALTYQILDAFLDAGPQDWSAVYLARKTQAEGRQARAEAELQAARRTDTRPTLPLEALAGTYTDPLSGDAEVRLEDGRLVFDYNPRHLGDLEHWHGDTFRVTWRHPIFDMPARTFLTFAVDEYGEATGLEVTFYDPIYFERVDG